MEKCPKCGWFHTNECVPTREPHDSVCQTRGHDCEEIDALRARVAELEADNASWKRGAEIRSELFAASCERITGLSALIANYAAHDSWRCAYYDECHCGLDERTDLLGLPRVPRPPKE